MNDRVIEGHGTAEANWLGWLARQSVPRVPATALCAANKRLVVIAPHPDDEILACGGLLALCAKLRFPVLVVAITDGEASHGLADESARAKLCRQRVHERCAGLVQLGVDPQCVVRLKIPDGLTSRYADVIFNRLKGLLRSGDLVVTTWVLDGHPDHETTAQVALRTGCNLLQAPVWMWHWAQPDDARIPWGDLVALDLTDDAVDAKQKALARHHSQLGIRNTKSGPVLAAAIVQRAARLQEYFFIRHHCLPLLKEKSCLY